MDRQDTNSQEQSEQNHQPNGTSRQSHDHEHTDYGHETTELYTESLEYYQVFLERLLGLVSNGHPETVDRLIALIRSGASQQEIFAALSELATDYGPSDPGHKTQAR